MNEGSTDLDRADFEAPVAIAIEALDSRFLGYILVDALGVRGGGKPPLVAANIPLNEAIIDSIRTNAERLGPDQTKLTHVRLKKRMETKAAERHEPASLGKRIELFQGMKASFDAMKERFDQQVGDVGELLKGTEDEAFEKMREVKIELDPGFRQTLEAILHEVLVDVNRATLFACLETYEGGTFDHSLRVYLMGSKMLAKALGISPGKFRENKRMVNYSLGMLYHDTGMLLIPESIRQKTLRIPEDEFAQIRKTVLTQGIDPHCLATIMAVNDPRYAYKPSIEKRLVKEVEGLKTLVDEGVLTEAQYQSLAQFPDRSCLTPAERAVLRRHPIWGWEIVRGSGFSSPHALDIIRHHHQRLDLSGYPDLQVDMSIAAQIAAAADIFDALVSERAYSQVKPYDVAFGILDTMTSSDEGHVPLLDRKVFELLAACVEKYPVGSLVKIVGGQFGGCIGQVIDYTPYNINRPSLVVFRDKDGQRIQSSIRIGRKQYDGSFHIRGLPFTDTAINEILGE